MITIPLSDASLCVECESISDGEQMCPSCGSSALMPVARWIPELGPVEGRARVVEEERRRYAS